MTRSREIKAADEIIALYSLTDKGELLTALATLGVRAPQAKQYPFVVGDSTITEYAKIGASEFIPKIASAFEQTTDRGIKNAAAWALVRFGQEGYASYLAQLAQTAIAANPIGHEPRNENTEALKYLGSLQVPLASQVLEQALDSHNPVAVQYAVVNLLFNQTEGSKKAKQVVLRELRGEQHKLGVELMLEVASKLDDPEICAAGEAFEQRSSDKSWHLYSVERRQWPIYNWIDDYVVALNQ